MIVTANQSPDENTPGRLTHELKAPVLALINGTYPAKQAKRLSAVLDLALNTEGACVLTALDGGDRQRPLAAGFVLNSMHDFSHWGINLAVVKKGYEAHEGVQNLLSSLMEHAKNRAWGEVKNLNEQSISPSDQKPVCFSAGTCHPEIFEKAGFTKVHQHIGGDGAGVSWMVRVIPDTGIKFFEAGFSDPSVLPARHGDVRLIETAEHIAQAQAIITGEWGAESGRSFQSEYAELKRMPGSAVYGVFDRDTVIGVGAIIKALHHDEAWSRAWIVVDREKRGGGVAQRLIQTLMQHADENHARFSEGPVIMEGFTYIPEYYRKYGNQPVAQSTETHPRGTPTWTMRITSPPGQ